LSSIHRYACRHHEFSKADDRHGSPAWLPNTGTVHRELELDTSEANQYWVPSGVVIFHRSLVFELLFEALEGRAE
jgi:hypothetical protein